MVAIKNVADESAVNPAVFTPAYWTEARKHLVKKDRVMKRLIPQFGDVCLETRGDAFTTLARSVGGQQISVKAAQSVWGKLLLLVGQNPEEARRPLGVEDLLSRTPEVLRPVGRTSQRRQ